MASQIRGISCFVYSKSGLSIRAKYLQCLNPYGLHLVGRYDKVLVILTSQQTYGTGLRPVDFKTESMLNYSRAMGIEGSIGRYTQRGDFVLRILLYPLARRLLKTLKEKTDEEKKEKWLEYHLTMCIIMFNMAR